MWIFQIIILSSLLILTGCNRSSCDKQFKMGEIVTLQQTGEEVRITQTSFVGCDNYGVTFLTPDQTSIIVHEDLLEEIGI